MAASNESRGKFLKFCFLLVAFGTMFQAAAVNLQSFAIGIPIISVLVFFSALFLLKADLFFSTSISRDELSYQKYFFPFVVYSIATAFFLPVFFAGLPVYVPRLIGDAYSPTGFLQFNISNFGEALYLLFNFIFVVITLRFLRSLGDSFAMSVFQSMGFFALFFTFYQFFSVIFHFYYPTDLINSNKFFAQGDDLTTGFGYRLSGLFTEPSYNGNFLGTYFVFFIVRSIWSQATRDIVFSIIFLIATLLVTSTLGYIEIVFGVCVYLALTVFEIIKKRRVKYLFLVVFIVLTGLIYALGIFFHQYILYAIVDKSSSGSYLERSGADNYAYSLFLRTWGFGVGLGSNRPSGMFAYLLSNVGAIGTILFVAFLIKLLLPIHTIKNGSSDQKALMFGILAFMIGRYFGVADIAYQYFWLIIIIGGSQARSIRRDVKVSVRSGLDRTIRFSSAAQRRG